MGSADSLVQVLAPLAQQLGARLSTALGVTESLSLRLQQAGESIRPDEFRVRQLTRGIVSLLVAGAVAIWAGPPWLMALALVLGAPLLVVLADEQRLSGLATRRERALRAELPVVVEQLGMLLSAGYSVSGALTRLSSRSGGVIAQDLRAVMRNVRHGSTETAALDDWAQRCGIDAVRRLVAVLSLHGTAGDLGSLIADEAHAVRAEAQRELLESIERRSQLVWIPGDRRDARARTDLPRRAVHRRDVAGDGLMTTSQATDTDTRSTRWTTHPRPDTRSTRWTTHPHPDTSTTTGATNEARG